MNKLVVFYNAETKHFKFTPEQYYNLELEYNRYSIYKSLIKQIEIILKISEPYEYNNCKKYESKNIIDRFILECINHGITPDINMNHNSNPNSIPTHTSRIGIENITITITKTCIENDIDKTENFEKLSHYIFFNPILDNSKALQSVDYYSKMIAEFNEKKLSTTLEKQTLILNTIINANKKFNTIHINLQNNLLLIKQEQLEESLKLDGNAKPDAKNDVNNNDILCSLTQKHDNYIIIKYRDFSKTLNLKRYSQLIKNYDRPYPYDMVRMLLRYAIFDMSNQQWSIGKNLYDDISETFNISFEMFASPLNFNMNMYCSIFLDTDRMFGSLGSFYNLTVEKMLNQNIKGVVFNPPYLPLLMTNCTKKCINILDEMAKLNVDFTIVSFLPNWSDADYIKRFLASKYVVIHKVVNKGSYVLHEKDKGKIINGTFDLLVIVLNSMHLKWSGVHTRKKEITDGFANIIKTMKEETRNIK